MPIVFFILSCLVYLFTTPAAVYFMWLAIQRDEMFGKWQDVLDWIYEQMGKSSFVVKHHLHVNVTRFLGGCDKCFANLISLIAYIPFYFIASEFWWPEAIWARILLFLYLWVVAWNLSIINKRRLDLQAKKIQELDMQEEINKRINNNEL